MAYQTRGRDPLFDSDMQAAIERRGKELIGLLLLVVGLMSAMAFWSYSPDDPSWTTATDAPVRNWMGRLGAGISAPLFMVLGLGAWGLAGSLIAWGVRMLSHVGDDRMMSRLVFAPIWIVALSIWAAALTPGADWTHNFRLGGLFGDAALGTVLGVAPFIAAPGMATLAFVLAIGALALGAFVLGFTKAELGYAARLVFYWIVVGYAAIATTLSQVLRGGLNAGLDLHSRNKARKADRRAVADEAAAMRAAATIAPAPRRAVQAETFADPDPMLTQSTLETPGASPRRAALGGMLGRLTASGAAAQPHAEPHIHAAPERAPERPAEPIVRRARTAEQAPQTAPAYEPAYDPAPQMAPAHTAPTHAAPMQPAPQPAPGPRLGGALRTPQPMPAADPAPAPAKTGLLSRLPGMMRRADRIPESELVDPEPIAFDPDMPTDDRIKAKIADVVRARARTGAPIAAHQPLTKGRGRGPDPLIFNAQPGEPARAEPPLTQMAPQPAAPVAADPMPAQTHDHDAYDYDAQTYDANDYDAADYDASDIDTAAFDAPEIEPQIEPAAALPLAPAQRVSPPLPSAERPRVVQSTIRKPVAPSSRARAEAQPTLQFDDQNVQYELPPLNLLESPGSVTRHHLSDDALEENARMLESVLDDYGVKGEIVSVRPGPVVTMYELEPAPGLKASRVIGLADDIARSMSALSARVSTVPGRSVIGIELPNENREKVVLREILSARDYGDSHMKLPLALGKDIGGDPMVANLAKMPHLLIAGTTGSGKSVAINTMILSLLYRLTPEECRMIMIDPKMLELSVYDGIPHLLSPVVTDPKKAVVALKWVVGEMEDRYRKMSKMGVRNIDGFNGRVADALAKGELFSRTVQTGFDDETGEPVFETEETTPEKMPYIVVIVDEMADLMMVAGKEIEACIQRLAQMARASGIHLIMATQRPSVDVITGTIKANFPTRISFQVTSKIDSRTILGEMGAEQLLGMGDMLYMAGGAKITRCHGPFVSDEEVEEVVTFLKGFGPPSYIGGVVDGPDEDKESDIDLVLGLGGNTEGEDALYDQAVAVVVKDRKCSTSYIQRKLGIGYNKAARLVEQMEDQGLVSTANHVGKREILVPEQQ